MSDIEYSTKKAACPFCDSKTAFRAVTKYFDIDSNNINPAIHGKCHKCGHFERPQRTNVVKLYNYIPTEKTTVTQVPGHVQNDKKKDVKLIEKLYHRSMKYFDGSEFHKYLISLSPAFSQHLRNWHVGTDSNNNTIFWYWTQQLQIEYSKCFVYGTDGKRSKTVSPLPKIHDDLHGIVWMRKDDGFDHDVIFGEHFLSDDYWINNLHNDGRINYNSNTRIFLVESEKTAIIGSFVYPEFVWLASGGADRFNIDKAKRLSSKDIILLIDNDEAGLTGGLKTLELLRKCNCNASVVNPSELFSIDTPKIDIADILLEQLSDIAFIRNIKYRWLQLNEGNENNV